nr:hypothetical protein [uncultured Massilia sp.]
MLNKLPAHYENVTPGIATAIAVECIGHLGNTVPDNTRLLTEAAIMRKPIVCAT